MKKLTAIILAFAMLLSLCACGVGGGSSNQFVARINYTENSGITVTPDVLSSEYKTSDTFAVTIDADTKILDSDGNAIDQSFLTAGLEVVISFDGIIDSADPPRITAEKIELRNGVVSGTPAPQTEDTVTFTEDGEAESVKADRVGLKGCYILVPQEDWLSKSAQDTQVGPLIIYPTASENSTLTFRVYVNESASSVRELLTKQHKDFSWKTWTISAENISDAQQAAGVYNGEYFAAFTAQIGSDAVSLLCRCPADQQSNWGAKLAQIASTLAVK